MRTYTGEPVKAEDLRSIREAVDAVSSPFGGDVTISIAEYADGGTFKPGTYGVIKGARDYLMMAMADDDASWLAGGYKMEQVILRATQAGLGTCWIAATFNGSTFERQMDVPEGEALRIVSPVGYAAERRRLMERITRSMVRASSRMDFDRLFSCGEIGQSLGRGSKWREPLELMRLAPSSTNSQPWRAIASESGVDFYYKGKSRLAILDMGIGLCHFDIGCRAADMNGEFFVNADAADVPNGLTYLMSYRLK